MIQKYTWELPLGSGDDVEELVNRIAEPAQMILDFNRYVTNVEIDMEDQRLVLAVTMAGHDRWWIRKRAPFLITTIVTRARYPVDRVRHIEISTPPSLKKARFRTEDGRRVTEPLDGSEPGPQLTIRPCKTCRDERLRKKYWSRGRGWRTGPGAQKREVKIPYPGPPHPPEEPSSAPR